MNRCEIDVELPPAAAQSALAAAADESGGRFVAGDEGGGLLELPVVFGLRRGVAAGRIEIARLGDGRSRLVWQLESSRLELHRASVAVLLFAAVPLVATIAWPFYPQLIVLLPFAAVTGLLAWWLVVSRLRSSGPEEFLAALAKASAGESSSSVVR